MQKIIETYSQSNQDIFVHSIIGNNGSYIELGGQRPVKNNNTYLLETKYNWNGVSIELDTRFEKDWKKSNRRNSILWENALTIDYVNILSQLNLTNIDYLSCDLEPAYITFCGLNIILNSGIRPKVITYEHDRYRYIPLDYSNVADRLLKFYGYKIAVYDVTTSLSNSEHYETWYVREDISVESISYKEWYRKFIQ